jgi:hypothetical protein
LLRAILLLGLSALSACLLAGGAACLKPIFFTAPLALSAWQVPRSPAWLHAVRLHGLLLLAVRSWLSLNRTA